MAELFTERAAVGAVALVVVLLAFFFLVRSRKTDGSVADAVLDAVQRLSKAAPELRNGLTEQAADQATKHLVEMLKCVAIGITDSSGRLLSWDGGANEHYEDLTDAVDAAVTKSQREHINHTEL